jgi:acyl-CoA thioester hydrolase
VTALALSGKRVLPEWIDYNGHLMDGYYLVAFSDATEAVLAQLGFGPTYREQTGCTIYTVEAHVTYRREVTIDTPLSFATQVLDHDEKRIHVVHDMMHDETGDRLATAELMFVHVRQSTGKIEPMPAGSLARVAALAAQHAELSRPPGVGRSVGIRRDPSAGRPAGDAAIAKGRARRRSNG